MNHDADEPTGYTGDRDQPPTMDRMADLLQLWDATASHPRDEGDYLHLSARLLALDEDPAAPFDFLTP